MSGPGVPGVPGVPGLPGAVPELEVDPVRVEEAGLDLLVASSQLDDLAGLAAGSGRLPTWTGVAAEDYRGALRRAGGQVEAMSLALRAVARRVDAHARVMQRLVRRRDELVDRRQVLLHDLASLADDVAAHGAATPGVAASALVDPAGAAAHAARGEALARRGAGAASRAGALEVDVRTWSAGVAAEERGLVEALDRVATLPQVDRRFGGVADPADAALDRLPGDRDPARVRGWWASLTVDERLGVVAAAPGLVGALDGLPARVRDRANRAALLRDLADWRARRAEGTLTPAERRTLANAEAARSALDDAGAAPVSLWLYDPDAFAHGAGLDGRVAVAHGDLDTAATVAVSVPGMGTEALDAVEQSRRAADLLGAARAADPDGTFATVAWIGYDAPAHADASGAAHEAMARAGGERLADALDGLTAARGGEVALVPVGHSYGSTTLGSALSTHALAVGPVRAAVVGSPGLTGAVHDVGDLGLTEDSFFVGRNHDDLVARLGTNGRFGLDALHGAGLGHDPADDRFGATRFGAEAAPGHDDHSSYFEPGSESLANLGRVVAGVEVGRVGTVHDPWWGPAHDPEAPR